ncbi:MAG: polysaccharide deacetylase family protein, partial [bacterium]
MFQKIFIIALSFLFLSTSLHISAAVKRDPNKEAKKLLIVKYGKGQPKYWGVLAPGVKSRINSKLKVLALTFDACPGGYDARLITFLKKNRIKATLFISGNWMHRHRKIFKSLVRWPLFEVENHGYRHRP